MKLLSAKPTVVAIGNFDGLHLGHKAILDRVLQLAETNDYVPAVLTFSPHPRQILQPNKPLNLITTPQQKQQILNDLGIKQTHFLTFNDTLRQLSPQQFIEQELLPLNPEHIVIGNDFRFGHKAAGDVDTLTEFGKTHGFAVHALAPVTCAKGESISSTRIRAAMIEKDFELASRLLGRPISI